MRRLFSMLAPLVFLLTVSSAHAETLLTCTHRMTAVEAGGAGCAVTLDVTVTNAGVSAVNFADLTAKDPFFPTDSPEHVTHIGPLAPGESVAFTWTVPTALSPEQLRPGMEIPLYMDVRAVDDTGAESLFELSSEGGGL